MNIQSLALSLLLGASGAASQEIGSVTETYRVSQSYPEGITYDAANKRILLTSLISNSIMSFDPANNMTLVTTYTPNSTNPGGLGLKVDSATGQVYATIDDFTAQDNGGLAVYELPVTSDAEADATVVSTVNLPCTDGETKCGLANDVILDDSGVAYLTDSAVGRLFKVENGEVELISDDSILQWTDASFPFSANGLVHVADLGILLVFNIQTQALLSVDLTSNEITEVTINGEINGGGDGMLLSSDGILYAVTGGTHITAFSSEDDWASANVLGTVDVSSENETAATMTFGETEDEIYVTHVRFGDLFGGGPNEDPSLISKVVLSESTGGANTTSIESIVDSLPEEGASETTEPTESGNEAETDATDAAAEGTGATAAASSTGLTPTDGDCLIEARLQEEGEDLTDWVVPGWHPDGNIVVKLAGDDCDIGISDTWSVAGWTMTIVQIGPNQVFTVPTVGDDMRQAVKILRGTLLDVNYNGILKSDGHWHTYTVTTPNRAIPLWIDNAVTDFTAGDEGAVITYWTVSKETLATPATDMTSSPIADVTGPYSENLEWIITGDLFGSDNAQFIGVEFWNLAGILVQENDGSRLMYMQWWTFREDFHADAYHKEHPLFGEVHMAMFTGSSVAGMQTTLPMTENLNYQANPDEIPEANVAYGENDQTEVQIAIPMPPGFAHGPLWYVDPSTGEPARDCDGNMVYPYHRTLVDDNGEASDPLRYHLWVAFEHPPEDVTVPLEMLTEWPNANLQSTMPASECGAAATDAGTDAGTGVEATVTDTSATAETEESDDVTEESDDVTEESDDVTEAAETKPDTSTDSGSAANIMTAGMGIVLSGLIAMLM